MGEVHGSSALLLTVQNECHEAHTEPPKANKQANIGLDERPVQQSRLLFLGCREFCNLG